MEKSDFQFHCTRLEKIDYAINNKYVNTNKPIKVNLSIQTKIDKNIKEKRAQVLLNVSVFKDEPLAPFSAIVNMSGLFSWGDKSEKDIDKLLKINAPATVFSYIRPIITNLSTMSMFTPLFLPLYNFSKTDKIAIKNKSNIEKNVTDK
ncbi:protein-export chaperone SecB [Pectinatus frisingensis]|uniref:protein-export chaperone SecB n=1 Tax=Pectinatus frisingensis TaxID=865 RepID=UPI0018C632C5|nr:protein-export chaperone SecB [Pectinatus frisingensis]